MHAPRSLLLAGLALAGSIFLIACPKSDDDTGPASDDTAQDDTGDSLPAAEASVSGSSYRTWDTCPPTSDLVGTLCVHLGPDCQVAASAVASAEIADADFGTAMTSTVDWTVEAVADGTWQLWGFLDDDATGCAEPSANDLLSECQEVIVAGGADLTDLVLELVSKCSI